MNRIVNSSVWTLSYDFVAGDPSMVVSVHRRKIVGCRLPDFRGGGREMEVSVKAAGSGDPLGAAIRRLERKVHFVPEEESEQLRALYKLMCWQAREAGNL